MVGTTGDSYDQFTRVRRSTSLRVGKLKRNTQMDDDLMMLSIYCSYVTVALGRQECETVATDSCAAYSHGVVNMMMITI